MPWPSRTLKALSASPSGAVVEAPVGQHAVHVEHQQPHARSASAAGSLTSHPARSRSCTLSAPTRRARLVDDQQRGDAVLLHQMRGLGRELLRRRSCARRAVMTSRIVRLVHVDAPVERAAQVAVGEDAERPGGPRRRRPSCRGPSRHLDQALGERRVRAAPPAGRRRVRMTSSTCSSSLRPSAPPGCERAKSCVGEAACFEQRDGERIAHRQRRRGAGGRREIERAGFRRQR